MNNEIPETLAAAQSRVSDLKQQLRLSDEGVSWRSGAWNWNSRC